jgi:23S rRNA pseudouridine2604 synthase
MPTLKLKKPATAPLAPSPGRGERAPLRGAGSVKRHRPTAAEAAAERVERQANETAEAARHRRPPTGRPAQAASRGRPAAEPRHDQPDEQSRDRPPERPQDRPRTDRRLAPDGPANAPPWPRSPVAAPRRSAFDGPAEPRRSPAGFEPPRPVQPARPGRPPQATDWPSTAMPRLAKRISELGLASRAEADDWIARGWVRVDGRVVSRLGARVHPDQAITIDPRAQRGAAQRVTLLLNKPPGPVAGASDDTGPPVIACIEPATHWPGDPSGRVLDPAHRQYLSGIGAIDAQDSGLLVLTQDGRLAHRLRDAALPREIVVTLADSGPDAASVSPAVLALLRHGLALDGQALSPAEVRVAGPRELLVSLVEHRPRQVRRMFELVGLAVSAHRLERLGPLRLGELPPGQWRYVSDAEGMPG